MGIEKGTTYKLADKRKRNKAIISYKVANPDVTLIEMANIFKLSPQRIFVILLENHKEG